MPELVKETKVGPHAETNNGTDSNVKSEADTTKSAPFERESISDYTIRKIGKGGFGVVYEAQHNRDEQLYAIKEVDIALATQPIEKVMREAHIMRELSHQNIVKYYNAWQEGPLLSLQQENDSTQKSIATTNSSDTPPMVDSNLRYLYIRMELCCDQTLRTWLSQNQRPDQRPISQTLDWFRQLVSAVKYIHDKGLIHRDIKPGNIFFGSSRGGAASVLKIGDLGLATYAAVRPSSGVSVDVSKTLSNVGTEMYMSPEQPSGHYKNSTDIYSLGLVFLEMVYPFEKDAERYAVFGALRAKQRPTVMNQLDKEMDTLIRRMTTFEPKKRATSSELDNELKKKSYSGISTVPSSEHPDDGVFERVNFTELLSPELMLKIFGYLYEGDLTRCALVSRKFRAIANHQILWKSLYQEVFEYSLPLLYIGHARFEFREPHDWPQPRSVSSSVPVQTGTMDGEANDDEPIIVNPWKESFKQLKHGIHVRPGFAPLYSGFGAGGRRLTQCDRLDQALRLIKTRDENTEKLIFLHAGLYIPKTTVTINSDIQIIGASAGPDIASQVIIERRRTTTVTLAKGSQGAYLGWLTIRFAPDSEAVAAAIDAKSPIMHMYHCALQICDDSTALVEHCVVHSSATDGAAVCVKGRAANPKMQHCVVCDCESAGIYVADAAQGQFEDCEIARNNLAGVWVKNRANPFFRRCHIHDGRDAGIVTLERGMGYFESCDIHNNQLTAIKVEGANPMVTRCEVHHGRTGGVYVYKKGQGQFMENRIHSNEGAGIEIASHSDPKIRKNEIYNGLGAGICISDKGRGLIEENEVYGNTSVGIFVMEESSPIIRKNRIHSGEAWGIDFCANSHGLLEENDIFNHQYSGVQIRAGSNPKIVRNKIWGNQEAGIIVISGQGVLEENEIFDNAMYGVEIEIDSNPTLRRNKIYNGRGVGVLITGEGRGVLEDNDIYRNAQAGVIIAFESNPTLRRNRVYEGRGAGIEIKSGAMATLESNAIFHNRFGGLFLATGVRPTLRDNKIYDNDDLVEKTIAKGGCLFEISSWTSSIMHDFYRCDTCDTTERGKICLNCIRTCHAGHDVRLVYYGSFFCNCGGGGGMFKHQCKLWSEACNDDSALSSLDSEVE